MDDKSIDAAFKQFEVLLRERLENDVPTTEDSIRYTLFHCLTTFANISPKAIILEHPHMLLRNCFVDTYVVPAKGEEGLAFEFKYDRKIPSGRSSPRTQKAGKVFADLFRLAFFEVDAKIKRYFVYITDHEMATYFENTKNRLDDFFNLPLHKKLRLNGNFIKNHSSTFVRSVGENVVECDVECHSKGDFDLFSYRIYEVIPT